MRRSTPASATGSTPGAGTRVRPAACAPIDAARASTRPGGSRTARRSSRERTSTARGGSGRRAPDHPLHARLEHQLTALVQDAVPVADDAAVGPLRLPPVCPLHLDPERVGL